MYLVLCEFNSLCFYLNCVPIFLQLFFELMNAISREEIKEGRAHLPLLDMLIKKVKLVIILSFIMASVFLFISLFIFYFFQETKLKPYQTSSGNVI